MPSFTYQDGQFVEVPDTVIMTSCEIREPVKNTLIIQRGAHVKTWSRISGTVIVENGAILEAHAPVGGTAIISAGGQATFYDRVGGSLHVDEGGAAMLSDTAVALGTIKNDGVLTNKGVRGTQVSGKGRLIDTQSATVRQPDEVRPDGTQVYYN